MSYKNSDTFFLNKLLIPFHVINKLEILNIKQFLLIITRIDDDDGIWVINQVIVCKNYFRQST